ncbi:MAG: metal ABC transporter permease [Chlamydiia bacterium]
MAFTFADFFTHPVLKASTFATLLLSIFCSLFGCILFVRRKALLAETLSHAAYVGVVLGLLVVGLDFVAGAASALLGLFLLHILEKQFRLSQDVALTVTLAVSLSFGTFLASIMQLYAPVVYKQSLIFLYGQAATMLNIHVLYFSAISFGAILFLILRYRVVAWSSFDPVHFAAQSIYFKRLEILIFILLSFAVVIGSRASGIMLVSGMMIAPSIFARAFTHNFGKMLLLASAIGATAALSGTFLSVYIPMYWGEGITVPTGPLILVTLATLTLISLILAPQEGLLIRMIRAAKFQMKIRVENSLKHLYRQRKISRWMLFILSMLRLQKKGVLTVKGEKRAVDLIRIHRLWEVYITQELGVQGKRVHESAEEMEHFLNAEMERKLTELLNDPAFDPHNNEIPKRRE